MRTRHVALALLSLSILATSVFLLPVAANDAVTAAPQQPGRGGMGGQQQVFKNSVQPNWFDNSSKFWYRNVLRGGGKEFILVDAEAGTRGLAFDHAKLADGIAKATEQKVDGANLPFDTIQFTPDAKSVRFMVNNVYWKCDLTTYAVTKDDAKAAWSPAVQGNTEIAERDDADVDPALASPQQPGRRGGPVLIANPLKPPVVPVPGESKSPDEKWTAVVHDNNVFLKDAAGKETQLSKDGVAAMAYARLYWSSDSTTLVAYREEMGDHKVVYHVESSPPPANPASPGGAGRAQLQEQSYDLPGDKFDSLEMNIFDVATLKQTKPETGRFDMAESGTSPGYEVTTPHWMEDGTHFLIEKVDRGHQRLRVFNVNARTGETKAVIDEQSQTFVWTANRDGQNFPLVNMLRANPDMPRDQTVSNEIIYASEKSGWRHFYLINATTGESKPIDHGDWVLRNMDHVDQAKREIWFMASGVNADQDPYLIQYGHVKFDGSDQVFFTAANGNHTINFPVTTNGAENPGSFSPGPDYKYVIDSYNRVDLPPTTELRRVSDGKLIVELEKADVPATWTPTEVFTAKGRDDKTDIWGIITRPANFDPTKKYPIIEDIYAGPHGSFVPKTFSVAPRSKSLTDLGFIVVQIDGMGTANRSKAFHDVCWHNIADAGFLDRIKWMKAAAAKYPYMDIDRVGIFGTSAGGQDAAAAVLFHPEFYKVAVANCGCHDNRMDKATWNEEWMGYPIGQWYSDSSNIDNAWRLQGHLQLVVAEMDNNVPTESTFRFADALNRANKDYEFVYVPGADHGATRGITSPPGPIAVNLTGETIVQTKLQDFFVRYLLHQDPPERNAPRKTTGAP